MKNLGKRADLTLPFMPKISWMLSLTISLGFPLSCGWGRKTLSWARMCPLHGSRAEDQDVSEINIWPISIGPAQQF